MRRFLTIAVFAPLAGLPAVVFPAVAADTGPEGFIRTLGNDLIIDGVSMGAPERAEFASVIQRSGGQVQGLLAMMREKSVASAGSSPPQAFPLGVGGSLPPR